MSAFLLCKNYTFMKLTFKSWKKNKSLRTLYHLCKIKEKKIQNVSSASNLPVLISLPERSCEEVVRRVLRPTAISVAGWSHQRQLSDSPGWSDPGQPRRPSGRASGRRHHSTCRLDGSEHSPRLHPARAPASRLAGLASSS